jgi:hypothetical protein
MTASQTQDSGGSIEFLIAEYNQISEETRRLRNEGLSRLNFFITITSSILAGLVVLSQSNTATDTTVQWVSLGALFFLILVGWNAFKFTISRDISTDFNVRATGRIHRFFMERDPSLRQYLTWQDHDEPTAWIVGNTSNLRSTAQWLLSSLVALALGLTIHLLSGDLRWSVASGGLGFGLSVLGLQRYAGYRFGQARKKAEASVRFRKTPSRG